MNLKQKHEINAGFSMSGMTDVIFLLLIFFMLTSSFVSSSGLPVNLPSASNAAIVLEKVNVTITKDLSYFLDGKPIKRARLEALLRSRLGNSRGVVVLHCDQQVPVQRLVEVASIATALEAKVSVATKPMQ